ncbi:MAG TPA: deoxyribonuclease II family protein [Candidatus Acidoferrales bacterium]|nr:deoxyribonuclease II family protein [Candidatus Acidoferrales bacterium]
MEYRRIVCALAIGLVATGAGFSQPAAPRPLLSAGQPVDWWFVFKFNTKSFPGCGGTAQRACIFGGTPQTYKEGFGQQFALASSENAKLTMGGGCVGDTTKDPVGATFDQVYNGSYFYAIWNDQFKGDPEKDAETPWGHSKGMVAWNGAGEGFVMQVSTPSWPAAGSKSHPRKTDGNTLGCVKDDDVEVSQHFFALRLTKDDLATVLKAVQNASVATAPKNLQVVKNGGPADIQQLVNGLGVESKSTGATMAKLSTGVRLISKPSALHVPVWQLVSAELGGIPLRAATWWEGPKIPSTTASTKMGCWDKNLGKPGAVEIATSGQFGGKTLGLLGGACTDCNHAKVGVSTDAGSHLSIFGDMNQQGDITGKDCKSSQNGRGGLFYVLDNATLFAGVKSLIQGSSGGTGGSN